jgi:uncharacterized protein
VWDGGGEGSCLKLKDAVKVSGALGIDFGGERLHLLPQRAVWWEARGTLLLADVHFGKSAAFRALGVPVPGGSTARDLARIGELIAITGARRLIILGDLVHGPVGENLEMVKAVSAWRREQRELKIMLVRGNHDRAVGPAVDEWQMEEVGEEFEEEGFRFCHVPPEGCEGPTFAGHVHPTAQLRDFDGSVVWAPCFVLEGNCLIVPSFGTFTGGYPVYLEESRQIFVVSRTRVVKA